MYVYAELLSVQCELAVTCCSGRRTNCLIYAFFYSFSCITKVRITVRAIFRLLCIQNSLQCDSAVCSLVLVLGLRPRDHVTAALIDLHWLPVAARIEYKLCTLVYQSVTGNAPTYINDMLQPVSDLDRPTQLRSASKGDLAVPRTRLKLGE